LSGFVAFQRNFVPFLSRAWPENPEAGCPPEDRIDFFIFFGLRFADSRGSGTA
jgi:hypothetical protein